MAADPDRCAFCGTTEGVRLRSPDMDIEAAPICLVCWYDLVVADDDPLHISEAIADVLDRIPDKPDDE